MKLITLYLPETYLKGLDELVNEHFYPNRSAAIREAVRDLLKEKKRFNIHCSTRLQNQIKETQTHSRRSTLNKEVQAQ